MKAVLSGGTCSRTARQVSLIVQRVRQMSGTFLVLPSDGTYPGRDNRYDVANMKR